ncbi:heavy metal transporter [Streptomyces roseirectus]|uniref:Heavy metal transporter n=1 Tax=Streptomyces roseirectus TaxID=2768066 RepID=A0A7H0IC75_9ACTN|nr:heavy metal transporter [Streptomyces roseirectus]QNP70391.1 heavy metal transporter [Streptomyces roseirectus]
MSAPSPSPKRRGRLLRSLAAAVVLLAVAGYVVVQYITGGTGDPGCRVVAARPGGKTYEFTPEQAVNAATIAAVGTNRGMPERAVTIALATALQESGLRNLAHGDRDSLGLFQQRPSQGWGTEAQVQDPSYAANRFYEHLAKVRGYADLPLTVAAQRVQRSGYPDAYAKHEPDATVLAAALTGRSAATLTCTGRPDATSVQAGPDAVRAALVRDFGRDAVQAAGTASSAADQNDEGPTAVSGGRTVALPVVRDTSSAGRSVPERGWQLAHWAVANSSALHIQRVTYAGRTWVAGNSDSEWRAAGTTRADMEKSVRITTEQ